MKIKGILYLDTVNYKKICLTLMMPYCSFKCGKDLCQNSDLAQAPIYDVDDNNLLYMYCSSPIIEALCFQGLEPMDSFDELINFIKLFRQKKEDDIVIYTGYTKEELEEKGYLTKLKEFGILNIVIKYERFIPNQKSHFDEVLGVVLASENQYAERIC